MPSTCAPMATVLSFNLFAARNDAPPSMTATGLPTGVLLGSALGESARVTRIVSGSSPSASPTTVATIVSCPWPDEVVCIVAVIAPVRSTLMRQESIQVVVVFFGLSSGSNDELPPFGAEQGGNPNSGRRAARRRR